MEKYRIYNLDGTLLKVLSRYDEKSQRYIDEFPDLEEEEMYSVNGRPLVSAVQDRCRLMMSDEDETDCGSCKHYKTESPGDLVGVCTNDDRRIKQDTSL